MAREFRKNLESQGKVREFENKYSVQGRKGSAFSVIV